MNRIIFTVLTAIIIFCASPVQAETQEQDIFTNSEFLMWEQKNQEFFIGTSLSMAILIVAQYDKTKAQCITDMFGADERGVYDFVLDSMKRFPNYSPKGTVLAVIEKKCGKLKG